MVNTKTNEIICTAVSKGKVHDFKIWKESQIGIGKKIELLADKGYQGIISFESKSKLINHYQKTLGSNVLFGNIMAIDSKAASKLINQYFV